ncbi:hypothetical protein I5U90_02705 [Stenotrophomonas maltophilia]|uniref:hypothetical protein n=1 Tax=Stenotrophomonas muris TaxID=2963283 RepID=UPI0013107637|nr:hypothetical protein [Stenotrophomonas maltophilia]MBH1855950.1 hypothetical protein [Stenotrophomonas maltophilia]MBN5040414.1 hypothetical protein [Stenotrophomonas maltophilia]MBN5070067.1 hypothetical protein [Stenotrophomonas maltophilia]MCU0995000.1 hypothetical protein [Stenotrophomonas maltophilia]
MSRDLFHSLRRARFDLQDMPGAGEATDAAVRIVRQYRDAVTVDVIYRSQVGPCIPFTPLPKQYQGKKVRIVIEDEGNE